MQRLVVLVTGMSGTGKFMVLAELARRGHWVVDTDEPGWIVAIEAPDGHEPGWDLARVGALLDGHRVGRLFVGGCVANQGALCDRFDAVVLLTTPLPVVLARVAQRDNPFAATPQDRNKIADDLATYEPRLRAGADHEVVTTVPITQVVEALERVTVRSRPLTGPQESVSATGFRCPFPFPHRRP